MKALLICPADRPGTVALKHQGPLVNLPIFGKSLISYWMDHLKDLGVTEVLILAVDRPEQVRAELREGVAWGITVHVQPESRELTAKEARKKYMGTETADWLQPPQDINVVEHLPGMPAHRILESYAEWFAGLAAWLPQAATPDRVGVREFNPGVWVGFRTHIDPSATFRPPVWIGEHAVIGRNAIIGPQAFIEDRVVVGPAAEVADSAVGPETYVGELTEVKDSLAWGNQLINLRSGSRTRVTDTFLLCSLRERPYTTKPKRWFSQITALLVMGLTLPVCLWGFLKAKRRGEDVFRRRIAVRPGLGEEVGKETLVYYELTALDGWWRCWPQMWNIARGEFAWVGNPPLEPSQVAMLSNDFERLWLAAPIGLFSLAEAEGCAEHNLSDEERVRASYYAVQANWRLDLSILFRYSRNLVQTLHRLLL